MNNNGVFDPSAGFGLLCILGVGLAVVALVIAIWWQIWAKAGYSGAMSLLMMLPIINLVMLLILAFGEWPVQQEVRRLRRELADLDDYRGGRPYGGEAPRRSPRGEDDRGITR